MRSASGVRPKQSSPGALPSRLNSSHESPASAASPSVYWRTSSVPKRSLPAGTGVCVVKTVEARIASSASSRGRRPSTSDAQPLEREEGGVALVDVEDGRHDAERGQGARPADAEHELLPEPVLAVAPVERVGDAPGALRVALDVGVEEQERHAGRLGPPDLCAHGLAGQVDGDRDRRAARVALERQAALLGIDLDVALLLAVAVDGLAEVAHPVEQADGDEREAEVGGRLEVVSGEDAEPARVDGQLLADAELHAEVGDVEAGLAAVVARPPGGACRGRGGGHAAARSASMPRATSCRSANGS